MMNAIDAKKVVDYVRTHAGCTESDIAGTFPEITNLPALLRELSEGVPQDNGYILEERGGRFYLGPQSHLV